MKILKKVKDFDTVNHQILLSTLSSLDITGIPLRWFESYLTGRSFRGGIQSTSIGHWGSPGIGSWTPPLLHIHYITGSHHTGTWLLLPFLCWWHTALSLISTRWSNGSCTGSQAAWRTPRHGWKNTIYSSTWQRLSFLSSLQLQLYSMISRFS